MVLPLLQTTSRFPHPDWEAIRRTALATPRSHEEMDAFYVKQGLAWVEMIRDALGGNYAIFESRNFWVLGNQGTQECQRMLQWLEQIRADIRRLLGDVVSDELYGKVPVIMFADIDVYYEYYASYLDDGEYPASSGAFISRGYGHFLFPFINMTMAEPVVAHELTHSLLSGCPIPLWLNEGLAQLFELKITGHLSVQPHDLKPSPERHWNEETLREFWGGEGFRRQGGASLHCYYLSMVLTKILIPNMPKLREFIKTASRDDAGESALRKTFGFGLNDLATEYFGETDWLPKPRDEIADGFGENLQF